MSANQPWLPRALRGEGYYVSVPMAWALAGYWLADAIVGTIIAIVATPMRWTARLTDRDGSRICTSGAVQGISDSAAAKSWHEDDNARPQRVGTLAYRVKLWSVGLIMSFPIWLLLAGGGATLLRWLDAHGIVLIVLFRVMLFVVVTLVAIILGFAFAWSQVPRSWRGR